MSRRNFLKWTTIFCSVTGAILAPEVWAHTISIGYTSLGSGAVDFWYGTYHSPSQANFTEGSLQLTGPNSFSETVSFTQLVTVMPAGLVDGNNNFYANGSSLSSTNNTGRGPVLVWQGVEFTGLAAGTYTFTYIPITNPTQEWDPLDSSVLSNTVILSPAFISGGTFQPNATSQGSAAASQLDALNGTATGAMADAITALQNMDAGTQHEALQHVAPDTGSALGQTTSQVVTGILDSVSVRLDDIRTQGYSSSLADDLSRGETFQVADGSNLNGLLDGTTNHTFWTKAFGAHDTQNAQDGFAGYGATTAGASFGGDTLLDGKWVVGGAFTYAYTDVSMHSYRSGDNSQIGTYQLTAYGTRNFGPWYIESMGAYARETFQSRRDTGVTGIADGDFGGNVFAARLTAGVPIAVSSRYTLTPTAGLEANYLTQDSYTETNGGPLAMHYGSESATRLDSAVGAKFGTETQIGSYGVQPSLHFTWRNDLHNDGIDSTTTFTGGGTAFTTAGQTPPRNTYDLGATVVVSESKAFALSAQVDGEVGTGYTSYAGQLLGQWRF